MPEVTLPVFHVLEKYDTDPETWWDAAQRDAILAEQSPLFDVMTLAYPERAIALALNISLIRMLRTVFPESDALHPALKQQAVAARWYLSIVNYVLTKFDINKRIRKLTSRRLLMKRVNTLRHAIESGCQKRHLSRMRWGLAGKSWDGAEHNLRILLWRVTFWLPDLQWNRDIDDDDIRNQAAANMISQGRLLVSPAGDPSDERSYYEEITRLSQVAIDSTFRPANDN